MWDYFQGYPWRKTKKGATLAVVPQESDTEIGFQVVLQSQESGSTFECLFQLRICCDSMSNFLETAAQSSTAITTKCQQLLG